MIDVTTKNISNRENAKRDWLDMIYKSWTWELLTAKERALFEDRLLQVENQERIRGTYKQRWDYLNDLYMIYLDGIGREAMDARQELRDRLTA